MRCPGVEGELVEAVVERSERVAELGHGRAAAARPPGSTWRTGGRTCCVNGRSWSRSGSVVASRKSWVERSAGPQRLRLRDQLGQRRAQLVRERVGAGRGCGGSRRRVGGSSRSASRIASCWSAKPPSAALDGVDEARDLVVAAAELVGEQAEVVDDARERRAALGERAGELRRCSGRTARAGAGRAESCLPFALAADPLGPALQQQGQVLARVGVEGGEELVGVDVRLRARERDRRPVGQLVRWRCPGSTSTTMSLRFVFGRSSSVRVGVDQRRVLRARCPSRRPRGRPRRATESILPIWIPATITAWPWPGVTACAEVNSPSRWKKSWPKTGTQLGSAAFCWLEDPERDREAGDHEHADGEEVARRVRAAGAAAPRASASPVWALAAVLMFGRQGARAGLGGPTAPRPALRSGGVVGEALDVGPVAAASARSRAGCRAAAASCAPRASCRWPRLPFGSDWLAVRSPLPGCRRR